MSLTDLQAHVLAYYTSGQGKELVIATRWYPHAELIMILEDKMAVAVRKFGRKAAAAAKAAATQFVNDMIAKGAWSSQTNDFGGTMHQFQSDVFPRELAAFNAASPIVQAAAASETYWADKFAELTT